MHLHIQGNGPYVDLTYSASPYHSPAAMYEEHRDGIWLAYAVGKRGDWCVRLQGVDVESLRQV